MLYLSPKTIMMILETGMKYEVVLIAYMPLLKCLPNISPTYY